MKFIAKNRNMLLVGAGAFLVGTIMGKLILTFAFIAAIVAVVVGAVVFFVKESEK